MYTSFVWVRWIQSFLPFGIEATSLGLFLLKKPWDTLDPSFLRQGLVLYGIVLTCQVLLFVFRGTRERFVSLVVFFSASFVIGYPMGQDVSIETLLYAAGLFNLGAYLPYGTGVGMGVLMVSVSVYLQQDAFVWRKPIGGPELDGILFMGGVEVVFLFLAIGLREAVNTIELGQKQLDQLTSTVHNLTRANVSFQEYADSIVETSLLQERKRISRELHDTIGYSLTNIRMLMEEAIGQYDGSSEDFLQLLTYARDQAKTAMEEARAAFKALRSMEVEQTPLDLRSILRLAKAFSEATHLKVTVDFSNTRQTYGNEIDRFLYRFVQEGMTNALRHGQATHLEIYLHEDGEGLKVSLIDNGRGGKVSQEGIGLLGMRERVRELGGELHIGGGSHGFSLYASLPLEGGSNGRQKNQGSFGG